MSDPREHGTDRDDPEAVDLSREELVAEADQFLDLSGADPETHGDEPAR